MVLFSRLALFLFGVPHGVEVVCFLSLFFFARCFFSQSCSSVSVLSSGDFSDVG